MSCLPRYICCYDQPYTQPGQPQLLHAQARIMFDITLMCGFNWWCYYHVCSRRSASGHVPAHSHPASQPGQPLLMHAQASIMLLLCIKLVLLLSAHVSTMICVRAHLCPQPPSQPARLALLLLAQACITLLSHFQLLLLHVLTTICVQARPCPQPPSQPARPAPAAPQAAAGWTAQTAQTLTAAQAWQQLSQGTCLQADTQIRSQATHGRYCLTGAKHPLMEGSTAAWLHARG
jgi:hypothetical protein